MPMTPASTSSSTPLIWALRISLRLRPNVNAPLGGRPARRSATIARPIAPASVSMCAASESSASESAITPTTTSTTMKPRLMSSATTSQRVSLVGAHAVRVGGVVVVAVGMAAHGPRSQQHSNGVLG